MRSEAFAPLAMACLLTPTVLLASVAHAQDRHPPGTPQGSARMPTRDSPLAFKRLEIDGIRFHLLALNDESCPLQIRSGRIVRSAVGTRALSVELKSVLDAAAESFQLAALVFDAQGVLKVEQRVAGAGVKVESRASHSIELSLERANLAAGDHVVIAVREVAWKDGPWRSDEDQVRDAARVAVIARASPKGH